MGQTVLDQAMTALTLSKIINLTEFVRHATTKDWAWFKFRKSSIVLENTSPVKLAVCQGRFLA